MGPDVAFDSVTSTLMSGKADAAYFASLPENVTPSTDDNRFFFYTARFGNIAGSHGPVISKNNAAVSMTMLLIVMSLLACVYYIVTPFVRLARRMPLATLTPPVVYFCSIGMAFMLIEISQMQRLMVFLRASRLWTGRGALHYSSVWRDRQHHGRCADPAPRAR